MKDTLAGIATKVRDAVAGAPPKPAETAADKTYTFGSEKKLKQCLVQHPCLNTPYFKEKKITETVADLVAKRTANEERSERGLAIGATLVVHDLRKGEDGYTGEKLPKIDVPANVGKQLVIGTIAAITDCAQGKEAQVSP